MNREVIDSWLERAILVLVLAVLTLGTMAFGGVRLLESSILSWLILGAAFLWLVRIWATPKFRFLWPPVCWAVLAFALYAVARYFTADIEYLARHEVIRVLQEVKKSRQLGNMPAPAMEVTEPVAGVAAVREVEVGGEGGDMPRDILAVPVTRPVTKTVTFSTFSLRK